MKSYLRDINANVCGKMEGEGGKLFTSSVLDKLIDFFDKNNKIVRYSDNENYYETARYNVASMLHRTNLFSKTLKRFIKEHVSYSPERTFTDVIKNAYMRNKNWSSPFASSSSSASSFSNSLSPSTFSANFANDCVLPTLSKVPFMGQYLLLERPDELILRRTDPRF